jgi:hypothetical protein
MATASACSSSIHLASNFVLSLIDSLLMIIVYNCQCFSCSGILDVFFNMILLLSLLVFYFAYILMISSFSVTK